jgi:2-oxoglutarate ferredoxin oxidoreductase subunit beta
LYKLEDSGYDGSVKDPNDSNEVNQKKGQAIIRSFEWGDKVPIGVFYRIQEPTYEDMLANRMPSYKEVPLTKQDLFHRDVTPLFEDLA